MINSQKQSLDCGNFIITAYTFQILEKEPISLNDMQEEVYYEH